MAGAGREGGRPRGPQLTLSVVLPALNEQHNIRRALLSTGIQTVGTRCHPDLLEVIVVDGGSTDDTVAVATQCGAKVLQSPKGRGKQLNLGAQAAKGDLLLFLHADSELPPGYYEDVVTELEKHPPGVWGCFEHIRIQKKGWGMRLIERGVAVRTRYLGTPYGDQAIFMRASTYKDLQGFREWPLLEDYEMVARLRKLSRPALVPSPLTVSGRRWQKLGPFYTTIFNQFILVSYHLGVDPETLGRWYYHPTGLLRWFLLGSKK